MSEHPHRMDGMGKYAAVQYVPRQQTGQPVDTALVDSLRHHCERDARDLNADMDTFTFEELVPATINGMTLESEDTPYKSSEWATFRWTAEVPD